MKLWPFRNLGLKALSLGLAVLLWMVVAGEEPVERGLRVPLEFQQVPAGLEIRGEPPTLVDLRVSGSSGTLSRTSAADIVAVLDLHTARPGQRLFQLTPEQVRVPFGIQVLQVSPASVAITFEKSAARQVPVVPSVEGAPAPGYIVGTVTSDPAIVEVTGPESSVERVTEAMTEPVSVAGAHDTVSDNVTVGFVDPALRLKSPRLAAVQVQVVPGPAERTLRDRPIRLRNLGSNLDAQALPSAVEVVLRGTRQSVNRVDLDDLMAFVDLTGLGVGDYSMAVRVDASQDAGVVRINPETVQVRITSGKH